MKKFYYSKEISQDESPIYPMEHRNTIDANEQGRGMSARSASVNSLNLLEAPTIPRVKARDVTRSMSDVAIKSQPKAQNLITETELSSSWLYKTMQASINARFKSPRKSPSVHQAGDLEQSILQDPELKPIVMKSKAAKTSSCICHFATMIAISLCTVGFLASIAAIIYMEIFTNRNITSLHTSEAKVDLSDVILDSVEVYNMTTHQLDGEERILSESRTHRFDGDEAILNEILKASSTNDLPSLSNKNKSHEHFVDYVTDASKPEISESNDFNDTNSKIKFQDGITTIYEMKSEESVENDSVSDLTPGFQGRSFGFDQIEKESFESNFKTSPDDDVLKENLKEETVINTEIDTAIMNDSTFLDNAESVDKQSHDFKLSEIQEDLKTEAEDFKLKDGPGNEKLDELLTNNSSKQIFENVILDPEKLNSSEIFQSQNFEFKDDLNLDITNAKLGDEIFDPTKESINYTSDSTQTSKDSDIVSTNLSDFQIVQYEDVFRSTAKIDDQSVIDEHDVNTMVVTIDDTEVSTDSVMSKRNGEMNLFQVSSAVPSVEPVRQFNSNSPITPKKPTDIKVSLADAMKHLQKLDVNGKILTSRTKSKPKVKAQKPKQKIANKNEERKSYLQRMRLMLLKQMQ